MMGDLHNRPYLKNYRRGLRNNSTSAEVFLWDALKGKKIKGRKFRRQHSIGNYIVDFYCYSEKLVIEIDGSIHEDPLVKLNDSVREEYLRSKGCTLLRYTNNDVFNSYESVIQDIENYFGK